MKIAMFTNNYKPFVGGVPISIERLSDSMRELGHQVTVFAPESGEEESDEFTVRYRVIYEKKEKGLVVGNCFDRRTEKKFREGNFDIIHAHHPIISGQAALYFGRKYSVPVVYTYHTRYEQYLHYFKLYNLLEERAYPVGELTRFGKETILPRCLAAFTNQCDLIFAPTPAMKEYLAEQKTKVEISVLPTGIAPSLFVSDEACAKEIRSQHLQGRKWLFATTARLEKEKNMDFLIRGVAELKARAGDCFRVMVLGDGTERSSLEELAEKLGVGRNLIFLGRIPNAEVRHYLHASDAFLFASKSETQGIVLLEAMAAGCPVAAVKASGVIDVVEHGKNGFMTEEDAGAWAGAVWDIVKERMEYEKMVAHAIHTAGKYSTDAVAKEAERQYMHVIERSRQADYERKRQKIFVPGLLRLFKTA